MAYKEVCHIYLQITIYIILKLYPCSLVPPILYLGTPLTARESGIAFFVMVARTLFKLDAPLMAGQERKLEELNYKGKALR